MAGSRRDEILAIAAAQFAAGGVAGTTVRDISTAAGILSGSLYHHFQSKEEMVADLLLPVMDRQVGKYRAIIGSGGSAPAVLRSLIKTAVMEAASTPNETRMIRNDSQSFSAMPALRPVTDLLVEAAKLWASVVRRGITDGELRECDPKLVVAAMFDAVLSTTRWFAGTRPQSPERVGDALADLFLEGLRRS
ncbi:MAG TPA: TetR/AcrR family transcriptional regulator [Ilumatobacteraceae bacterium]|nr:TetR/AcrR family transcriptional regulator [Ilumatobacteraceae bacterium]